MDRSTLVSTETTASKQQAIARVVLNAGTGQKSLHAVSFFDAGELICDFNAGIVLDTANYLTVQIGHHKHITLQPEYLQYTNHSCDPSVFFDTSTMQVLALKPIQPGDELTFFYPSTEWEMAQAFDCNCGSYNCLRRIQGAAFLNDAELHHYRLTSFIIQQIENRKK